MKPLSSAFFALFLLLSALAPAQTPLARTTTGTQFDQMALIGFQRQLQRDNIHEMISAKTATSLLVRRVEPVLPKVDKKSGERPVSGQVMLAFEITKQGQVRHPMAISGPRELLPYAMAAVQQWSFKPFLSKDGPADVGTIYAMTVSSH